MDRGEADEVPQNTVKKTRVTRPRSPPSIYDVQPKLTQHVAVSLDEYLIERKEKPQEAEVQTQTAKFFIRPKTPEYVPKKTGIDASTQIEPEDGLFDFDLEVEPILDVLVGKILEQGQQEVEEEVELLNLRERRAQLLQDNESERKRIKQLEEQERTKWAEKEVLKKQEAARLAKEQKLGKKVASVRVVQRLFQQLQPSVMKRLQQQELFVDPVRRNVQNSFVPWLMEQVSERVDAQAAVRCLAEDVLQRSVSLRQQRLEEVRLWRMEEAARIQREWEGRQRMVMVQSLAVVGQAEPVGPVQVDGNFTSSEAMATILLWLKANVVTYAAPDTEEEGLWFLGKLLAADDSLLAGGVTKNGATLHIGMPEEAQQEEDTN